MPSQSRTPRKRSAPSLNDHPVIVDIFRKFCENGLCVQANSFRVTMLKLNYFLSLFWLTDNYKQSIIRKIHRIQAFM